MNDLDGLIVNVDVDEIFAINNKDITPPAEYSDVVVKGDNKSNSLYFKINRYVDGIDLFGKVFQIYYINADDYSDIVPADEIAENDRYIVFSWKIDGNVTHSAGTVRYIIKISSADYVWKSKPSSIEVVETLEDIAAPSEYESTWAQDIENRLLTLEAVLSAADLMATEQDIRDIAEGLIGETNIIDGDARVARDEEIEDVIDSLDDI